MTDYVIAPQTGHYFISPLGFISYSQDFLDACSTHATKHAFSPVQYYLACHSLELSLKAFLLLKGKSRDFLKKKLGHDLHKILKKCKEMGIVSKVPITNDQYKAIEILNGWYARKGFEYFEIESLMENPKALPPILEVQAMAKLFIDNLKASCVSGG